MTDKKIRTKIGTIISDKMDKTVTVLVNRITEHPIYKKKITVSKKYKAHDEENQYKAGEIVEIAPCKPISKDKSYKVLGKRA